MKKVFFLFLMCNICEVSLYADSFLTAQQFPKTFDDVSFVDRLKILRDGYEPYAAEYDDNGFCVKNCAYPGINIKQEEYIAEQDTQQAIQQSQQFEQQQNSVSTNDATTVIVNSISSTCKDRNPDTPMNQTVPRGEPLKGTPLITSPFGPRVLNGVQGFHDGIDYAAKIGTPVYAPAKGRVTAAGNSGRCGNMVQIKHEDGITTIYCHLSKIYVKTNQMVEAGCAFAETGSTGHSTGPHLHYAMKDSKGNKINPASYTGRDK